MWTGDGCGRAKRPACPSCRGTGVIRSEHRCEALAGASSMEIDRLRVFVPFHRSYQCGVAPARNPCRLISLRPVNRAGLREPARTLPTGGLVVQRRRHWSGAPERRERKVARGGSGSGSHHTQAENRANPDGAIVTAKGWGRGRQANAESRTGGCIG
jgi:hypothetical protein